LDLFFKFSRQNFPPKCWHFFSIRLLLNPSIHFASMSSFTGPFNLPPIGGSLSDFIEEIAVQQVVNLLSSRRHLMIHVILRLDSSIVSEFIQAVDQCRQLQCLAQLQRLQAFSAAVPGLNLQAVLNSAVASPSHSAATLPTSAAFGAPPPAAVPQNAQQQHAPAISSSSGVIDRLEAGRLLPAVPSEPAGPPAAARLPTGPADAIGAPASDSAVAPPAAVPRLPVEELNPARIGVAPEAQQLGGLRPASARAVPNGAPRAPAPAVGADPADDSDENVAEEEVVDGNGRKTGKRTRQHVTRPIAQRRKNSDASRSCVCVALSFFCLPFITQLVMVFYRRVVTEINDFIDASYRWPKVRQVHANGEIKLVDDPAMKRAVFLEVFKHIAKQLHFNLPEQQPVHDDGSHHFLHVAVESVLADGNNNYNRVYSGLSQAAGSRSRTCLKEFLDSRFPSESTRFQAIKFYLKANSAHAKEMLPENILQSIRNDCVDRLNRKLESSAVDVKSQAYQSTRKYDCVMRTLFKSTNPATGKHTSFRLYKNVRPIRIPCSKTVGKMAQRVISRTDLDLQFDEETGNASVNVRKAVELVFEIAIQQRLLVDADYTPPVQSVLLIQADSARVGHRVRSPIVVKAVCIHPTPQSPNALLPIAITTAKDHIEDLRQAAPAQFRDLDTMKSVTVRCRCKHVAANADGSPHTHVIDLVMSDSGDLCFLRAAGGPLLSGSDFEATVLISIFFFRPVD
jgi:hypothetical protein